MVANINAVKVESGKNFTMMNGDCCELIKTLPDSSIDFSVFSPPFSDLYAYSENMACMSNNFGDKQFFEHFKYLTDELYRVTVDGRNVACHCMNLPKTKQRDGVIGLRDFRGDIIRCFESSGFIYHSEVTVWRCPVVAVTRSKAIGLLHKQLVKDSSISRQGLPDYVCVFRKPGVNPKPVAGRLDHYSGENVPNDAFVAYLNAMDEYREGHRDEPKIEHYVDPTELSIQIWQKYASPVWMDIRPNRTLNNFREGRHTKDLKHICPLQLDVIERCLQLWSRKGDVVLSPFTGIGSEGFCSLNFDRRFIGFELKDTYFDVAVKNLRDAEENSLQARLF